MSDGRSCNAPHKPVISWTCRQQLSCNSIEAHYKEAPSLTSRLTLLPLLAHIPVSSACFCIIIITCVLLTGLLPLGFAMALLDVFLALILTSTMLGGVLAASSADQLVSEVCKGSGLTCVTNGLLREVTETATLIRDSSIVTINDLQKDFFVESFLMEGGKLTLDENLRDPAPRQEFLSSSSASALPTLDTSSAMDLVRHFGVPPGSRAAMDVATAAYLCGGAALPGEAKSCAASLDAMGAFVAAELGRSVTVYSTSGAPSSAPIVKAPVTISNVSKGSLEEGKKIVVCHHLAFPSMLYYCHRVTGTKVVRTSLTPRLATPIKAVAICHMNTALWLSRHPAYKALNIAHGDEACHFLVENDLVFTKATPKTIG